MRNALVYAGFAASTLMVQLMLLFLAEEQTLVLLGPLCLLVFPCFAWLAGFFTITVAFRGGPGVPAPRKSPRLGAAICAVPDLLLCASVGLLALLR